jgi:hypothetical protein
MLETASRQYEAQQAVAVATAAAIRKALQRIPRTASVDYDSAWRDVRPQVNQLLASGRGRSVDLAVPYTAAALAVTGQDAPATGSLDPARFLATDPSGYPNESIFDAHPIRARQAAIAGNDVARSLAAADAWAVSTALTALADTRRQVYGVDIARRPTLTGYVRQLQMPSCSRCVILAGKWFRWNEGFQRHPNCDCLHIPAREDVAGDLTTDPYAAFKSMPEAEQDRLFGRANAQAIRDGADIYRVENIRMRGLSTSRAGRRLGTPSRMTPEDIYALGLSRERTIQALADEGYITGAQVRGGNIVGRFRERFAAPISRPIVAGSNRDRVLQARASGVRDPLDRATMTAAERRVYDLHMRVQAGRRGEWLRSIGTDSASRHMPPMRITPDQLHRLEQQYDRAINAIIAPGRSGRPMTASMRRLLEALEIL